MKVAASPLSRNRIPLEGNADDTGIPSAKMAAKPPPEPFEPQTLNPLPPLSHIIKGRHAPRVCPEPTTFNQQSLPKEHLS